RRSQRGAAHGRGEAHWGLPPGAGGADGAPPPLHAVRARSQRFERHLEHGGAGRAHLRGPAVDALPILVPHLERAEGWLEVLGEPHPYLTRRGPDRAAHARLRALEEGVPARCAGAEQERRPHDDCPQSSCAHRPKRGRPAVLGKRSSRKKWIWPRMPTFLPVRSLTGTTASTPSWKYVPAQMTPGFTVPVGLHTKPQSGGLLMSISTRGMSRFRIFGMPMSRTNDWR